jgi:hypothetical protein
MAASVTVENLNPKVRSPPVFSPLSSFLVLEGPIFDGFFGGKFGF